MIDNDWLKIKHFNKNENWGNPYKMNKDLIFLLDNWREYCKIPFIIFSGHAEIGHNNRSYHYLGEAVDGELVNISLIESYLIASKYNNCRTRKTRFTGIGCYWGIWKKNDKYVNGLHLDIRTLDNGNISTWGCLPEIDNKIHPKTYQYLIYCTYGNDWKRFNRLNNQVYVPLDNNFFRLITLLENYNIINNFKE